MTFGNLGATQLRAFQGELETEVRRLELPLAEIRVQCLDDQSVIEAIASVVSDRWLNSAGNAAHRTIRVAARMFLESELDDREIIWGKIVYSVPRDHSNFFPVPEEYGTEVTLEFNWEFDRETLQVGAAELRDCLRLHLVSVLPNDTMTGFIECCSVVGERWAAR
jgi:hypothetical protein